MNIFDKFHIKVMPPISSAPFPFSTELELVSIAESLDESALLRRGLSVQAAEAMAKCARWTSTYPLQRVKKRRRVEAICPMLAPSISLGGLAFAHSALVDREAPLPVLDSLLREAASRFENDLRCEDPRLRCLVVVVPGVRGGRLLEATAPDREIKDELLRRGILVGEFFPSCPFATTFNPRLFALRSPAPMYVLRTFLESDWRFVCQVPAWQRSYRERFGEPPAKLRHLGGPLWRLRQKFVWRFDALRRRFRPGTDDPGTLDA